MAEEAKVGSAYIEISPELDRAAVGRLKKDLKAHLDGMAKAASKSLVDSQKDLMGGFEKQMKAFQEGKAKGVFAQHREEMQSWQKLQKQRESAISAEQKDQQRRIAELSNWYKKKQAIEKADAAEALKIAKQSQEDMDKAFRYRTMRALGASPEKAAQAATGKSVKPGEIKSQLVSMGPAAKRSSLEIAKAMDLASHSLSQLSTRIGLASFQLQLLGGFATTFFSGPVAYGLGIMAHDGLKFATSIGYARASMEALLKPSDDVEKILSQIRKMAIESPLFNTEDAIGYAQKLAAAGIKGKDLYKTMQALSNIFLTGGVAGPERANLAMMAYTQILSKGVIGMDDLRQQLAEHLPNAFQVFGQAAKLLGYKDLEELRNAMKSGEVSAEELNRAIIKLGSSEMYVKGATNAAKTLGGVWQAFTEDIQATVGMAFDQNRNEIIAAIEAIKPVVMDLIGKLVKALPTLIDWLGRVIVKVKDIKAAYDSLAPKQREIVNEIILISFVAGPAAIAIGILGTALSGAANAASLAAKSLALFGKALPIGGTFAVVTAAIMGVIGVLVALYKHSASVRKAVLQSLNFIKDVIANTFLPAVDQLIGAFQSLEKTFGFLGFETKDLAQVIRVLALPFYLLTIPIGALVLIIKSLQLAMVVLTATAYGLLYAVSLVLGAIREMVKFFTGGLDPKFIDGWRKSLEGFAKKIDVKKQWQGLTEIDSKATKDLQERLNSIDLTTTGLSGVFDNWNGLLDQSIQRQYSLAEGIEKARAAMQSQASTVASLTDASDSYNQSMISLKESVSSNGKTLNEHTRQGQANRTALKQATQAAYELMLQDIKSGVPMDEVIKRHQKRTKALKEEFGKSKETQAAAQTLINTYGKVPKDVKTLLELIGWDGTAAKMQEILAAQKVAANPGMNYSTALANERKAWQIEKSEGLRNGGVGKKHGGEIRGPGGPTGDKIPIMASDQEYMIRSLSAQKLGKPILDYINRTGELPVQQYAGGGQVTWPMSVDVSKTKFPEMLGGGPNSGGMGSARMMEVLRRHFSGLPLISGYRPGAVTSTGNRSYHALDRAVDIPPYWDVFNWISQNWGRGTKELIFTPAGGRQIKNGQLHRFSGGTIAQDHYDHIHWAYDNGGEIKPNQPFINKTGANELALNAAQGKALEQKIANSDRPVNVSVYVDGVKRDARIVFDEMADGLIQALGGA